MSFCEREGHADRGRANHNARAFEDAGSFQQATRPGQTAMELDLRRGQGSGLHAAAMYGDVPTIRNLIVCEGRGVDSRDMLGRTPFRLACKYYHLEAATELLRFGADLQAVDNSGTSVHTAAKIAGQVRATPHDKFAEICNLNIPIFTVLAIFRLTFYMAGRRCALVGGAGREAARGSNLSGRQRAASSAAPDHDSRSRLTPWSCTRAHTQALSFNKITRCAFRQTVSSHPSPLVPLPSSLSPSLPLLPSPPSPFLPHEETWDITDHL